jgi:hypothetical protein
MKQQEQDWLDSLKESKPFKEWTAGLEVISVINVLDSGYPTFIVFAEDDVDTVEVLRFFPMISNPNGGWAVSVDHSGVTYKTALETLNQYQEDK